MSRNTKLILYSTSACMLCERAELLLRSMPELRFTTLDVVDIAHDATLLALYGESIPVLVLPGGETRVWPFNADDVLELLAVS